MNRRSIFTLALFSFLTHVGAHAIESTIIKENRSSILVKVEAGIPDEISDELKAKELAKEGAISKAQEQILNYVLEMKTRSGKKLKEAEIPIITLQTEIREFVKQGKPKEVIYTLKKCKLTYELNKKPLKKILKAH